MILAGDIGGTHTRLALFDSGKKVVEKKYQSSHYKGLEEIVREFLKEQGKKVQKGCFGVAGPVRGGVCRTTNLPWVIDAEKLGREVQIASVHLLNDLEANAYGIRMLKREELLSLNKGTVQQGNQGLIAAGTGLGEAGLFWDGKEHRPFACEGGHTDFAPRNALEVELLVSLQKEFGHVSYERIISGPGLYLLYLFLTRTGRESISPGVAKEMESRDPPTVISEWGSRKKDKACARVVEWFVSLYGAEAGNMALKYFALGGFYIGGGIAPHLIEEMKKGFVAAFVDKGRFRSLLETIPIWLILNDEAALLGAAYFAERR